MVPGETRTGGESDDNTPSPIWSMDKGNLLNKNNKFTGCSLDIDEKNLQVIFFCQKLDHAKMYQKISDENLQLMRERLMETVIWPTDDTNTEKIG